MSKSEGPRGPVEFIGPNGRLDPSSQALSPSVRAKMNRLLSGQQAALASITAQELPAGVGDAVRGAQEAAQEHMRRLEGDQPRPS